MFVGGDLAAEFDQPLLDFRFEVVKRSRAYVKVADNQHTHEDLPISMFFVVSFGEAQVRLTEYHP